MPESINTAFIKQHFFTAATIAAVATIPLYNNLNSIALVLFVIACVVQRPLRESRDRLRHSRLWMIPVLYFIWLTYSYLWDVTGSFSIKHLERYSTLLFIPPALALAPRLSARQTKMICFAFVAVTTAICIICLVKSFIEYQVSGDGRVFYYHYLGQQMELNAIFLSTYCLSSISWMLYFGFIKKEKHSFFGSLVIVANSLFLIIMILLLSSKLIIFLMILMLVAFLLYIGYIKNYLIAALVIIAVLTTAGVVAVNNLGYLKWRISETQVKQYSGVKDDQNGLAIRLLMWQNAWNLITERPLQGYGIRGARQKAIEKFREKGFLLGYEQGYHSHNQYLESALMAGIPALLLLVLLITKTAIRAIRTKNILLLLLILHFMCQSVIESTFEVQQELVFYLFFIFLFYYHPPLVKDPVIMLPKES